MKKQLKEKRSESRGAKIEEAMILSFNKGTTQNHWYKKRKAARMAKIEEALTMFALTLCGIGLVAIVTFAASTGVL